MYLPEKNYSDRYMSRWFDKIRKTAGGEREDRTIFITVKTQNLRLFAMQSQGLPMQMYKQGVLEIKDYRFNQ